VRVERAGYRSFSATLDARTPSRFVVKLEKERPAQPMQPVPSVQAPPPMKYPHPRPADCAVQNWDPFDGVCRKDGAERL
jgi:hypothetical protein